MSKQSKESTIEISPHRVENPPVPKVLVGTIIAVNAMTLAVTSAPKTLSSGLSNKRVIIEQGKNTVLYPSIKLKYRNGKVLQDNDEIANKMLAVKEDAIKEKTTADITFQQIIGDLRKENAVLKSRLRNSFPTHTIVYITGSSIVIVVSIVLLLLRFMSNIYTVDPYFIINALIIAITLLGTAIVSLKDWMNFLNER